MALQITRKGSLFLFFPALFCQLFLSLFHIAALSPFLAIVYNVFNKISSLWISLFVGLSLDLLFTDLPFGFYSSCYVLLTLLLYSQRRTFSEGMVGTLCFSLLIAWGVRILEILFWLCFGEPFPWSWSNLLSDSISTLFFDMWYILFFLFFSRFCYLRFKGKRISFPFSRKGCKRAKRKSIKP